MTQRTATVDSGGRGGYVTYSDPSGSLNFVWEAAAFGYEVMVPSRQRWEQDTGLPLAERDTVLTCLGEAFVAKRGGPGATFTVVETPYAAIQIRP